MNVPDVPRWSRDGPVFCHIIVTEICQKVHKMRIM